MSLTTPTTRPAILLSILILVLLGVACCRWMRAPRERASPAAAAPAEAPKAVAAPASPSARSPVPRDAATSVLPTEPLSSVDLRAALRRLAQTDMGDSTALDEALRPLLVPSERTYAVLELLKAGGLADGSHVSLEEMGALRALTLAALVFNAPGDAPLTLTADERAVDGRAFVLAVLRALPDVLAPVQELLADLLGAQRFPDGRPLIDLAYASELERLARAFPECAALFEGLLTALLALDGAQADALQALYVNDDSSPTLVGAGLARWLEKDAASALAWAGERYDREDTPAEVRYAITAAIARTAPVEDASRFLTQRASDMMLTEFMTVGTRPGGREVLEQDYWAMRVSGEGGERARKLLVSGMGSLETETLIAVAEDDPSPRVRAQAWTTLALAGHFEPSMEVLDKLRAGYESTADPRLGIPGYGVVSATKNFALRAKDSPALRTAALDLLRDVFLDRSQDDRTRESALEGLTFYLSKQEIEQLRTRR